jgi:hypothetical protein
MSRIRTIKPEFWEDEGVAALSRDARLLWIATWNHADDEGILRWTPDYIKAQVFPYDVDITLARVKKLMAEVVAGDFVYPYQAGRIRQQLALVIRFRRHQKINRPQPSRLPPPSVQNREVIDMYGRRDGMTCGICGEVIEEVTDAGWFSPYSAPVDNHYWEQDAQRLSLDHIVPKSKGGSDYPTNLRAAHISCNKGRGDRAVFTLRNGFGSVSDSQSDSVNDSVTASPIVDAGREEEGKRKGSSSSLEGDSFTQALVILVRKRRESRSGAPVNDWPRWEASVERDLRKQHIGAAALALKDHPGMTAEQLADWLEPPPRGASVNGSAPHPLDAQQAAARKAQQMTPRQRVETALEAARKGTDELAIKVLEEELAAFDTQEAST